MTEKIAEKIKEIFIRIEYLEKLINSMQQNLILTWTILGVVVASAGIALYNLSKIWVNNRVEQELDKKLEQIKSNIKQEMMDYIKTNPQVCYARGSNAIIMSEMIGYDWYSTINLYLGQKISLEFPTKLEVYYIKGNDKIIVEDIQANVGENNSIKIRYKVPQSCVDLKVVHWNITWNNELYE
ncbi:hypothetical protein [Clostridium sp. ZS2-4]|uniref:hypothetical protein n=1 Tax=Clostridium sp. ZS2-4 TaxID=2987703 RepID=UPI00227BEF1A|nr:hypothetical protein [Clostridium sp. ZS2-4]MCY6355369.1 hypothetical protein [Clostridium sp. ZS2-4]